MRRWPSMSATFADVAVCVCSFKMSEVVYMLHDYSQSICFVTVHTSRARHQKSSLWHHVGIDRGPGLAHTRPAVPFRLQPRTAGNPQRTIWILQQSRYSL